MLRAWEVWLQAGTLRVFDATINGRAPATVGANTGAQLGNRALNRVSLIARHEGGLGGSLHESLGGAAALDANSLAGQYHWLHVYAWLLPVLGFVGTAIGMASAISGFSNAIGGAAVDPGALVKVLSQNVIPGLASAFQTTVLALLAALVAYYCTSAIQSADQEALEKLDALSLHFLARVPAPELVRNGQMVQLLQNIAQDLGHVSKAPGELRSSIDSLRDATKGIHEAAQVLKAASHELYGSIALPYNVTISRGNSGGHTVSGGATLHIDGPAKQGDRA
jgi:biopolymer transport protein ExbB/TolQ